MKSRQKLIEKIIACFGDQKRFVHKKTKPCNNITFSQLPILFMLKNKKKLSVKDIADKLTISRSAVTQLIDGLEKKDYVSREIDPEDHRTVIIKLSDKAKNNMRMMKKRFMESYTILFDELSIKELENYLKINLKIAKTIQHKNN